MAALSPDQALLDVRSVSEFHKGSIPDAFCVPVDALRARLAELPKDKELLVFCEVGLRGYVAVRLLSQSGFRARNLSGGYKRYLMWREVGRSVRRHTRTSSRERSPSLTDLTQLEVSMVSTAAPTESPIDIGIEAKDRKAVAEGLAKLLADTYTLYLKTHNYHWNVTGPMFNTLHLMFEPQYNELALAVDLIAERIRALGHPAPGSYAAFVRAVLGRGGRPACPRRRR